MHCWNCASWKWRDLIKRILNTIDVERADAAEIYQKMETDDKNDKNKSALHANNLLPAFEVYGMMKLNLWDQTHIIGVMAKRKASFGMVRDRSNQFSHSPW